MNDWQRISQHIGAASGAAFELRRQRSVGGGCINQTYLLESAERTYFVKLNRREGLEMFVAEAAGLAELARPQALRVPEALCWGETATHAYLVLEYLDLGGGGAGAMVRLGQQLAALHRATSPGGFGWHRDNTIGSTAQPNAWHADWVEFWRDRRLGWQLRVAAQRGYGGSLQRDGERLQAALGGFFGSDRPVPSLLHGDLWAGNYAVTTAGEPVIFDPAVYYGDREADLAMTELFGGFSADFYRAYAEAWPLDSAYAVRKNLYNLYHIINHLNLFGDGYLGQAQRMTQALLAELKA